MMYVNVYDENDFLETQTQCYDLYSAILKYHPNYLVFFVKCTITFYQSPKIKDIYNSNEEHEDELVFIEAYNSNNEYHSNGIYLLDFWTLVKSVKMHTTNLL